MSGGGATFYADRAQLQAWFAGAGPGQGAVYATGASLDPGNETVRTVTGWKDAGLVTCVQGRGRDGLLRYQIQKARVTAAAGGGSRRARAAGDDPLTGEDDCARLYRRIVRAANLGQPCPSNTRLAEDLALDTRFHARRMFDRLVSEGHLRVIEGARFGARVVEICASGRRTGRQGETT